MSESSPKRNRLSTPARIATAISVVVGGVGLQTAQEATSSMPPEVTANPLSWPATPIAKLVETSRHDTIGEPIKGAAEEAMVLARKISTELYDSKNFPNGVPVPGILNGTVVLETNGVGAPVTYTNPIILESKNSSIGSNSLNGAWIGTPEHNAQGRITLHPMQIITGDHNRQIETVSLADSNDPVLYGAAIYPTTVTNAPDQLIGFDITGDGNFPSFSIESSVAK